ncbi:MAG: polyprenol phosphomannose-dependent alpha 1,6 mannosyltransferase MptB [Acidimicrobiales bacterium]
MIEIVNSDAAGTEPDRADGPSTPVPPLTTRSMVGLALLGFGASAAVVVGGSLAGAAGPLMGRLWSVPTIPVRPAVGLLPSLTLFYGGLIVLVRAWLGLRRAHLSRRVPLGAVLAIMVMWAVPMLIGPPLGSRDVYAYVAQGRMADQGYDVYTDGPERLGPDDPVLAPVDPLYHQTPVPYGPVFVTASSWVARVTGDEVVTGVLLFRGMAMLGLVVAGIAIYDLALGMGRDPTDAMILGVANPLVLLHLVSGAHNEAIMLAFLLTGVAVGQRRRWLGVGIGLCAMAAAIKLPAILGVAFLGWPWVIEARSRRRGLVRLVAVAAEALLIVATAGRLTGWGWGWVDAISTTDPVDAYLSLTRVGAGVVAAVLGLDVLSVVGIARLLGMGAAVVVTAVLLVKRSADWPLALAWSLMLAAFMHPTTQPWYLTWGSLLLAATSGGARNRTLVVGCAVAAFVVMPVGPQLGWLLVDDLHTVSVVVAVAVLVALTFNPRIAPSPRRRHELDPGLVSVIAPTRDERDNVSPFLAALGSALPDRRVEVVFVDDSEDDTPEVIDRVGSGADVAVKLLHRPRNERWGGLAGAVVDGLDHAAGATVVVMDADLQHPASAVRGLLDEVAAGADVVVASRRVPGGVDEGLTRSRRWLSLAAAGAAKVLFPFRIGPVADPLSGFFAFRLDRVDLDRLHPDGFKILVELLATHPELDVTEVPFTFVGRQQGMSKASTGQGVRYLGHLVDLRVRTSRVWGGTPVPARAFRSA